MLTMNSQTKTKQRPTVKEGRRKSAEGLFERPLDKGWVENEVSGEGPLSREEHAAPLHLMGWDGEREAGFQGRGPPAPHSGHEFVHLSVGSERGGNLRYKEYRVQHEQDVGDGQGNHPRLHLRVTDINDVPRTTAAAAPSLCAH